jgi:hypothetical protein
MATTTTKSETFRRAFAVDAARIRRFWQFVSEVDNSNPKITMKCSDSSTIETDDLETILNFPNARGRRIRGIAFDSGYRSSVRVQIELDDEPRMRYQVVGEDKGRCFFKRANYGIILIIFYLVFTNNRTILAAYIVCEHRYV